ncbi:hypothetical protein PAMC26577_28200 [Caballeronia sordidicola]|jgi:hypothetical protein|uniref:Uncharacterized protein n=1 Tax=Caballeronia sordidicola TaxID=196367 RepID=A0A242MG51_CABSO|nr:hypothetical protein PAMC26577_28200 [Caballeronia sordidicola]
MDSMKRRFRTWMASGNGLEMLEKGIRDVMSEAAGSASGFASRHYALT